jgi:hypothetical protein
VHGFAGQSFFFTATPTKHPKLLVHRSRLDDSWFRDARPAMDATPFAETLAQVSLDQCCIDVDKLHGSEHRYQRSQRSLVGHVCGGRVMGGLE